MTRPVFRHCLFKIMAEKFVIKAEKRDTRGKNEARRMRAAGKVPVVIYGGGTESMAASAQLADLAAILRSPTGVNSVFSLDVDGEAHDVIFQDRQIDPLMGRLMHADLRRFARGEKIEMTVPIHLTGEPEARLEEGAVLSQALREIKVLCEPAKTPEFIEVDVASVTVEHALHVSDLVVGEGIEIVEAPETMVASIIIVKEAELEPQLEEGAEPEVAGEAPAEAPAEDGGE